MHELGHALGLGDLYSELDANCSRNHVDNSGSIMFGVGTDVSSGYVISDELKYGIDVAQPQRSVQ